MPSEKTIIYIFALMPRGHILSLSQEKGCKECFFEGANLFPPPVADKGKRICCAAVEKIEEERKPEDFFGHRKRTSP